MNIILSAILVGLVIYFESVMVKTILSPLIDIAVAVVFIVLLCVVIVAELALMVVAPIALAFGFESRYWHIAVAQKLMFVGGKKNAEPK